MESVVYSLHEPDYGYIDVEFEKDELIASILMNSIPVERAAEAALELTKRYRSISEILSESPRELRKVKGVCDDAVLALRIAMSTHLKILRESLGCSDFMSNIGIVRSYCESLFQPANVCVYKVFFLRHERMIAEGAVELGFLEGVMFQPREIVRQAVSLEANGVYVAFGRKFGDQHLTDSERALVERLDAACAALDMKMSGSSVVLTRAGS